MRLARSHTGRPEGGDLDDAGAQPPAASRRVTSVDVARHLGVSQSTVSLALSGSAKVSEATRRRVLDACRELDYRPTAAGRRLRTGRSHTIGLFVPKLGYEVFDRILTGVRAGLASTEGPRWSVLVGATDNDLTEQESLTAAIGAHDFDGLILAAVSEPAVRPLTSFTGPLVGIETAPPGAPRRSYDLDRLAAALLDLLRAAGHRRIAHLTALPAKTSFALARQALQNAATVAGLGAPLTLDASDVTIEAGLAAVAPLFDLPRENRPTAVVCDDSHLAASVYLAAERRGLRVPRDVSVVTSHLDDVGRTLRPALTGAIRPAEAVGELAARALLDLLDGARVEPEVLLACELVLGESVAPPPVIG
jgi:LacI family repressor for deo operon, udp, cdd, tsx, nupC, and nupG